MTHTKEGENREERPQLVVFDFDDTVVDCNSDTWIDILAPNGKIPLGLTEGFDGFNWTSYMAQVFKYLKESGITRGDYERRLREMPFVAGMKELLVQLTAAKLGKTSKRKYEMIIISDANSFFIQTFLEFHGLSESFTQLFTNPGSFDESGCLIIQEYHHQDWCDISAINMCKGYILEKYIERRAAEGVLFSRVAYCGDGQNDLCPSLRLARPTDVTFPREGYSFHKIIKNLETASKIKAQIVIWESGLEILARLEGHEITSNDCKQFKTPFPIGLSGVAIPPTPPPSPDEGKH